jgi:hypothetical protein
MQRAISWEEEKLRKPTCSDLSFLLRFFFNHFFSIKFDFEAFGNKTALRFFKFFIFKTING